MWFMKGDELVSISSKNVEFQTGNSLHCLVKVGGQITENCLPLMPETIPFLAELLKGWKIRGGELVSLIALIQK